MGKKFLLLLFVLFLAFLLFPKISLAHPGNTASDGCHYCWTNCDSWGEVYGERHCHGGGSIYNYPTTLTCPLNSYYNSLSYSCECYSGYIVQGGSCVSANSYCWNNYGYNSRYNSLSDSCECSYGYVFNSAGTKCISDDEACQERYGFGSKASISGNTCECKYGYEWAGNRCVIETIDYSGGSSYTPSTYTYSTSTPEPTPKSVVASATPRPNSSLLPTLEPEVLSKEDEKVEFVEEVGNEREQTPQASPKTSTERLNADQTVETLSILLSLLAIPGYVLYRILKK